MRHSFDIKTFTYLCTSVWFLIFQSESIFWMILELNFNKPVRIVNLNGISGAYSIQKFVFKCQIHSYLCYWMYGFPKRSFRALAQYLFTYGTKLFHFSCTDVSCEFCSIIGDILKNCPSFVISNFNLKNFRSALLTKWFIM